MSRVLDESPEWRVNPPALMRAVTGLLWVIWGLLIYSGTFVVPGTTFVALAYTVLGVALMALAICRIPLRAQHVLDVVLLFGTLFAFGFWVHSQVYVTPAYGTDELAFDQGAATLLLHGINPFAADMGWTLDHFQVPSTYYTYRLDGTAVTHLSYPAQSFLVYVPVLFLGLHAQAAVYVDAAFWALGSLVLWLVLPRAARPLVPIVVGLTAYVSFVVGGVSDVLYVPFVVGALWRWDRFGERGAGVASWLGPVLLGTAAGMKQSVWFLIPFVVLAIAIEGHRAGDRYGRRPVLYLVLLAASFLAPNIPFIVWDSHSWVSSVILPLRDALVPFGQAIVAFPIYAGAGSRHLAFFTLAAACICGALLCALARWYPVMKKLIAVMPALILLFPTRSMASYFMFVLPGLLASATSVRPALPQRAARHPRLRAVLALAGAGGFTLAAVGLLVGALVPPGPLTINVVRQHATGELESVDTLNLRVTNTSRHALVPHFIVANGVYMTTPWLVRSGPAVLSAGQEADFAIAAPNAASMPSLSGGFRVLATTGSPATLSASAVVQPTSGERTEVTPQAVNQFVGVGGTLHFQVRVLDRFGAGVKTAGIPVALGQVVYSQEGLFPGESSINGAPEGRSPVIAYTDDAGVATFTVQAVQVQAHELFYQAWLPEGFPHGYSNMVAVWYSQPDELNQP